VRSERRHREKLDRRPAQHRSAWLMRRFEAAATHALPHRRAAAIVVRQLTDRDRACVWRPFFTHCHLAAERGVQHRNTSREIIRDLADVGLIRLIGYRPGRPLTHGGFEPYRYIIQHKAVRAYIDQHTDAKPLQRRQGVPVRTIEAWGTMMQQHRASLDEHQARLDVLKATRVMQDRVEFQQTAPPGGWLEAAVRVAKGEADTPARRGMRDILAKRGVSEQLIDTMPEADLIALIRQRRAEQEAVRAAKPAAGIDAVRVQADLASRIAKEKAAILAAENQQQSP